MSEERRPGMHTSARRLWELAISGIRDYENGECAYTLSETRIEEARAQDLKVQAELDTANARIRELEGQLAVAQGPLAVEALIGKRQRMATP